MLENFASKHIFYGLLIIFFGMSITNIFPIMFFILPDIFIFLGIFLTKFLPWYIPYLTIVFGAIIGEQLNFYLGYKYGEKILKNKLFQKEISKKYIKKLKENPIKTLIVGKLIPGIIWIIPILSGIIKMNPLKFLIINSIMVVFSIFNMFIIWYFGLNIFSKYFGEKVYYIAGLVLLLFLIYHLIKEIKKTRSKSL